MSDQRSARLELKTALSWLHDGMRGERPRRNLVEILNDGDCTDDRAMRRLRLRLADAIRDCEKCSLQLRGSACEVSVALASRIRFEDRVTDADSY